MPKSKQMQKNPSYQKLNIVTMGGKGGTGKTTFMSALVEWFHEAKIPVVLRDLDVENRTKGGLQHYHRAAEKINVHARDGLDVFFDIGDISESVVIADMGAGQGEAAMRWFSTASEQAQALGIGFLFVGVVNNDPASVTSVLQWANELQDRVKYWIVLNEMQEERSKFEYWHESEAARQFCSAFSPIVMTFSSRSLILQGQLADHGLTLGSVANRENEVAELQKSRFIALARMYRSQLFKQFDEILPGLLPEV